MENKIYDTIIIGGGPSGLTASIYSLRSDMHTLLIEKYACGGQTINTYEIKNYPGFENISGVELTDKMEKQAKSLGLLQVFEEVIDFDFKDEIKIVKTNKNTYFAKTVIICMGASARKLGIARENELTGKGVSYCAVCDGGFFKDKTVAIIGGGNSAMEDVAYLTNIAKKTYLINRSENFRAVPQLYNAMRKLEAAGKIEVFLNSEVIKLNGNEKLSSVIIKNNKTNEEKNLSIDGLFIEIGRTPQTEILKKYVEVDQLGYIIADKNLMTSEPGVFVAGDIRQKELRQIITACADGAIAANSAQQFLKR